MINRREALLGSVSAIVSLACEKLPEDKSCDIVTWGVGDRQECPRTATLKYAPEVGWRMQFCEEHAAVCATMPLVSM